MEEYSDRESFEQAYSTYIFCLKALAGSPEYACERYGDFNAAYELKLDVSAGIYLCNVSASRLSTEQSKRILEITNMLNSLPEEAVTWTTVADESLDNMRHQAWDPIRKEAVALVELLRPVTEENDRYFS